MTAIEYAIDLIEKFNFLADYETQKKCALIAQKAMLDDLNQSFKISKELHEHCQGLIAGSIVFHQDVKNELEKYESNQPTKTLIS